MNIEMSGWSLSQLVAVDHLAIERAVGANGRVKPVLLLGGEAADYYVWAVFTFFLSD